MADEDGESKRREQRTNLFVMAALASSTSSGPVRIRNLSPTGAYVQGEDLPLVGDRVRLRRGPLSVAGVVTRLDDKGVGIAFDRQTDVSEWLPAGSQAQAQQRVDRHANAVRNDGDVAATSTEPKIAADDLNSLADMLDSLADALSSEPAIVERYAEKLQVLDIAAQKIRKLAVRLTPKR